MPFSLAEEFLGDLNEVKKDSTKDPWLETGSRRKWIERDLFQRSDARVIVFGYQIEDQKSSGIDKVANQLLECLLECRESLEEGDRPLAFISQDFGGTIVKAALIIASQNQEKYCNIVNSIFALVFLGCPHRPEDYMSLVDSIATLLSCTEAVSSRGLVNTASAIASTIIEVNEIFLESCMLYRARILNVASDLPDHKRRVFSTTVATMEWSWVTRIVLHTDHASLLCEEIGKSCFRSLREVMHCDNDWLYPNGEFKAGLNYMISQLPSVRLEDSAPGVTQEALSRLSGLAGWVKGQGPRLLHIEHPSDQHFPLHTIVRLIQAQPEEVERSTRMFTFEFRAGDNQSDDIWAALRTLVTQALCLILPRFSEAELPERLIKILSGPEPTSEVFALFEAVNILLTKVGLQALWVLRNLDQSSSDVAALVGQLRGCCKFSEVKPHILFASVANQDIYSTMRRFNIETLIIGPADFEAEATPNFKTLVAQNPRLGQYEDTVTEILQRVSQDPKLYRLVLRCIQNLDDLEVFDVASYQSDQPETVFKMLYASLSRGERQQAARLLRWIDNPFRSLSISEATMAISLEMFLEMGSRKPWGSLAAVLFSHARTQVRRIEQSLCGMITLDNNEVGFAHPRIRRLTLEDGWYPHGIEAHLLVLDRLLRFLEMEADSLKQESTAISNGCHFRQYAAHYWPEHYRAASQDDEYKPQADDLVKRFLANDCAVQYTLTLDGGSIYPDGIYTPTSRKVALLTRHDFNINDITHLSDCVDVLGDSDLLFAALREAVSGSLMTFVQQMPSAPTLDSSRAEKVLSWASQCLDPELLRLLFEKLSLTPGIKVPTTFLQRAAELRVQTILNSVCEQPEKLEEGNMGSLLICVLFGYSEVAKRLVDIGSFKGPVLGKLLNQVLNEACQNGDPVTIRSVLADFPGDYDLTWGVHLVTACDFGNHRAIKEILQSTDTITSDRLVENDGAFKVAVREGFAKCATIILEKHPDVMDNPETSGLSLREAIRRGHIEIVKLLIDHGASIDANLDEITPLHVACQNGNAAIVDYLLLKGADVNARNKLTNATPLYDACLYNKPEAVSLLLKYGADPRLTMSVTVYDNWSPLEVACDQPDIVQMLCNHHPRPDFKRRVEVRGGRITALLLAALYKCTESVRILLQGDVDIDSERDGETDPYHCFTSLTVAVNNESPDALVRLLLEHGADVNHVEKESGLHLLGRICSEQALNTILEYNPNTTGLNLALNTVCSGHLGPQMGCARRLINAGASLEGIDTRDALRNTPLTNACKWGAGLELIGLLIDKGANANGISASKYGWPLHVACCHSGLDVVEQLVDKYAADVNRHYDYWGSALQSCCLSERDQTSKLQFLVKRGADVNGRGGNWRNILTEACFRVAPSDVRYLVDHGAAVSAPDDVGCLPVFAACFRGVDGQEMVEVLMSSGADISAAARDNMGRTAIHCAVLSGDLDLVNLLLAADPSLVSTEDHDGWTPIHWAIRSTRHLHRLSGIETLETATDVQQVAMVRYLVDRQCPGISSTVKVGGESHWTAMRIARYFGAPKAVQDVLTELSEQVEEDDAMNAQKAQIGRQSDGFCDGCYCDIRGKVFSCQEPSCWNNFLLCIKCIEHKDAVHPFHGHEFEQHEGDEFEEDTTE